MAKAGENTTEDLATLTAALTAETNAKIAAALEQLVKQAPIEEIGYGHPKYQQRLRDEGFMDEFSAPVFLNGHAAPARNLHPDTIAHAPQLRSGTYCGGKVDVARDHRGRVQIRYAHARLEDRMRPPAPSFDALVAKIWTEMQAAPVAVT